MSDEADLICSPRYNRAIHLCSLADHLTDHVCVIVLRELDEMLGVTDSLAQGIDDPCDPAHCQ